MRGEIFFRMSYKYLRDSKIVSIFVPEKSLRCAYKDVYYNIKGKYDNS